MKYKTTEKDRYGNMRSLEITTDGQMEVPPMTSMIPQYDHPGEPKGSDTVPAWLTPGEFVVNKEAVDLYGPQIEKMNDVGREIQDGDMSPNQAPPIYANEGKLLEEWKDLLKSREGGVRLDVYSPTRKPYRKEEWEPTSGIGHLLSVSEYPFEKYGQGGVQGPFADEAAANKQFEKDFAIALAAAQRNVGTDTWRTLSDKQQFGLANMAFQMGQPNQAAMLETMKAVKAGDWAKARQQAQYNFFKNAPDKIHSKTDWYKTSPTRVVDFQNFITPQSAMPDLPIPRPSNKVDPSLQQAIQEAKAQWLELNKPEVEISESVPSSSESDGDSAMDKTKKLFQKLFIDPYKEEGGPIYAQKGFGIPGIIYGDNKKPWWEKDTPILDSISEYIKPVPKNIVPGDVEEMDNIVDTNIMTNVPKAEEIIAQQYIDKDLGMGAIPPVDINKYPITYNTPKIPNYPYGTIDDIPKGPINLDMSGPKPLEEKPEGYVEDIMASIEGAPLPPAELTDLETLYGKRENLTPGYVEDGQVRFADKDLEEEVNRLLPFINKEVAGPDRDNLGTETKRAEVETVDSAASRLSEAAKKISDEAANAQQNALDTNEGKKALTDNTNTEDPKFKQVKGMLNFLFGDLIDGKELGRGVAIYLASRALGYDHNSTIGFVAKKYLTRVDAKNLAMDKFIKANAGKYEKGSLAEYKRTGDPSTLIPIGGTARPTGEEKAYYNAAGQKRMAYKFKKKNAQGDDITYYSWDKAGGSLKARVDDNWTADSSTVADTPEYNERMNKASTRIAKKIKELKESDQFDAYNRRKSGSGAMVNDYYTDILPENDSGAVARWAEANGFSAFQLDKGLQQAYTMAINEAKANPDANISSLVPYLEEATIKQRLDSFKGVPRISTAVVDGETITMEPKELVILNEKISNVMGGDTNRFWNEAARVWKTKDPDSGKSWPEIFTPLGKQNNLPPFALFAQVMLDNKMEQMAGTQ